jgi:hypothetical protein
MLNAWDYSHPIKALTEPSEENLELQHLYKKFCKAYILISQQDVSKGN